MPFKPVMPVAQAARESALLDPELLRTFVAIAESGSFSRAAGQTFRTPSAVSMQIKRLEALLERRLFERSRRRAALTADGERLLADARRLLRAHEEVLAGFRAPGLQGRVGLGATDDIGNRILPGVLARFARVHPQVQVDVAIAGTRELLRRVDAGVLDLALVTVGPEGPSSRGEVVHSEPLVWAGLDGGAAVARTPLPLALAEHGCVWRQRALDILDRAGVTYRVAYTCEHCVGQEAAMQADLAVAPFPASLVRPPLRRLGSDVLPALGDYQAMLVRRGGLDRLGERLAEDVADACRTLRE